MKQTATSATAKTLKNGMTRAEQRAMINEYLLNCIPTAEDIMSDYNVSLFTDKERVNFVMECFNSEYSHPYNKQRYPNEQDRFKEWLMGLPILTVAFQNYDIIQLAIKWGSLPANHTEGQAEKILSNWWNYISFKFFQLHTHLNKQK